MFAAPASCRHDDAAASARRRARRAPRGSSRRARRRRCRRRGRELVDEELCRRAGSQRLFQVDARALELRPLLIGRIDIRDRPLPGPLGRQDEQDSDEGGLLVVGGGGIDRVGAGLVPRVERPVLLRLPLRLDPDRPFQQDAQAGAGCVCRYATPPGGKSTRSQRSTQSPSSRSVSSHTSACRRRGRRRSAPRRARGRRPRGRRARSRLRPDAGSARRINGSTGRRRSRSSDR